MLTAALVLILPFKIDAVVSFAIKPAHFNSAAEYKATAAMAGLLLGLKVILYVALDTDTTGGASVESKTRSIVPFSIAMSAVLLTNSLVGAFSSRSLAGHSKEKLISAMSAAHAKAKERLSYSMHGGVQARRPSQAPSWWGSRQQSGAVTLTSDDPTPRRTCVTAAERQPSGSRRRSLLKDDAVDAAAAARGGSARVTSDAAAAAAAAGRGRPARHSAPSARFDSTVARVNGTAAVRHDGFVTGQ